MEKILLFIQTRKKTAFLKIAREMGYKIAVAEKDFDNDDGLADYILNVNTSNIDELIVKVVEFNKEHTISGILTLSEYAVEETSIIASILGLPGLSTNSAKICRNKYLTRVTLDSRNIHNAKYKLVENFRDNFKEISDLNFPLIIKPLKFGGSCAVTRVNNKEDLGAAIDQLEKERKNVPMNDIMRDDLASFWLVEEYLDGFEISVQAITLNGKTEVIAIHDKVVPMEGPLFVEEYVLTPSPRIIGSLEEKIKIATQKVLEAVEFDFGVSHVEFRIVNNEPVLIEVNARLGGGMTNDIVYHSTGVDLFKCLVELVVGNNPDITIKYRNYVGVSCIHAPEGIISNVIGFDQAAKVEGVRVIKQWLKKGDLVRATTCDTGGAVLTIGSTGEEAIELAKYAGSLVHFTV